jgi:hypothetical protein
VGRREGHETLVRGTLSLGDAALRAAFLTSIARAWDISILAQALDALCERAEQAEPASREALVALVDALNAPSMQAIVQRLREEAACASLWALERLVRHPREPAEPGASSAAAEPARSTRVPSDGRGRALTLGERKALARRPDRDTMQRLLADPHPDVIRRLLANPRALEDDVVRLAARRPGRSDILAEIARSTTWVHRPRVRMALVMNPATPLEISARIVGLLLRPELEQVAASPGVPASLRALCVEHLARRPPLGRRDERAVSPGVPHGRREPTQTH